MDDSDPADCPPTHLALVLKRRKINKESGLEEEPEETYAFVDLKYFQPLSANQYVMKSQVIGNIASTGCFTTKCIKLKLRYAL